MNNKKIAFMFAWRTLLAWVLLVGFWFLGGVFFGFKNGEWFGDWSKIIDTAITFGCICEVFAIFLILTDMKKKLSKYFDMEIYCQECGRVITSRDKSFIINGKIVHNYENCLLGQWRRNCKTGTNQEAHNVEPLTYYEIVDRIKGGADLEYKSLEKQEKEEDYGMSEAPHSSQG